MYIMNSVAFSFRFSPFAITNAFDKVFLGKLHARKQKLYLYFTLLIDLEVISSISMYILTEQRK